MATWKKALLGIGIFFIALIVIAGLSGSESAKSTDTANSSSAGTAASAAPSESISRVSSSQLSSEYNANEVSADQAYKGKKIEITGRVNAISKDISDDIYIVLTGKDEFSGVQVYVSDATKAAQLKKGQSLTVQGTCDGMIMQSPIVKEGVIKE